MFAKKIRSQFIGFKPKNWTMGLKIHLRRVLPNISNTIRAISLDKNSSILSPLSILDEKHHEPNKFTNWLILWLILSRMVNLISSNAHSFNNNQFITMKIKQLITLTLTLICLQSPPLSSQTFSGGFNFTLPTNDSTAQRFLPSFPAKTIVEADRVTVLGDKFMVANKPIRFWGVNIVAAAAFPPKDKAPVIAARMRKMGINLVRFHHLENTWSGLDGTIFNYANGTRQLQAATLDRLDYFIAQLKRNNIYVNMNLNVAREFRASDGVQGWDSLPDFAKAVTLFDPHLQLLQREYAQQLLGHTNPYTGQSLATDPVLAMVEMNNENSLYGFWKEDRLRSHTEGGSLIVRHNRMLDSLFQNFLTRKYTTNANLQTAWQAAGGGSATEIFQNIGFETGSIATPWELETHNGAAATFTTTNTQARSGSFAGQLNVTNYTGTDWHIQMKQVGFAMQKDTAYELSFWAKGAGNMSFIVGFMQNSGTYTWYNGTAFTANNQWQKFTYTISIPVNESNLRMTIQPKSNGTIWFDDFSFKKLVPKGLETGENLANRNVRRVLWTNRAGFSNQRVADNAEFYIGLQKTHFDSLRHYLKNTLNVRPAITGTNALVGPPDVKHQENMDYIDDHAYWDHPWFPNAAWSATDWQIGNTAQLKSARLDAITNNFSGLQMTNKPYTISEYNHAAPNRFRTEMPATWLAYGSLHGADGIMFFDYNADNDWETDRSANFFSLHRDNSIMALFPSCAWAFRQGLVAEDNTPLRLNMTERTLYNSPSVDRNNRWSSYVPHDKRWGLLRGIKTDSYAAASDVAAPNFTAPNNNVFTTSTNETSLDLTKGVLTTNAPNFASITGFLADNVGAAAGSMSLMQADQFGSVTWVSVVNNAPLSKAGRSLLTLTTKQQNTNMTWNGTNTVNNNWGNTPTMQQPATVRLRLNIIADSIKIYPLSNLGAATTARKVSPISTNTFEVTLNQSSDRTLWYGIEAFGNQVVTSVEPEFSPIWNRIFPNPVCNGQLTLDYTLLESGTTLIRVVDPLGRVTKTLFNGAQTAGQQVMTVQIGDLVNGQYNVVISQTAGAASQVLRQAKPICLPITILR
jgi:hypothetical protein